MEIVADTTKWNDSSTWNILLTPAKCPRGVSGAHFQMETLNLQMAIVANATKIHKCKRVGGGVEHAGGGNAKEGGGARLRSVAQ